MDTFKGLGSTFDVLVLVPKKMASFLIMTFLLKDNLFVLRSNSL